MYTYILYIPSLEYRKKKMYCGCCIANLRLFSPDRSINLSPASAAASSALVMFAAPRSAASSTYSLSARKRTWMSQIPTVFYTLDIITFMQQVQLSLAFNLYQHPLFFWFYICRILIIKIAMRINSDSTVNMAIRIYD